MAGEGGRTALVFGATGVIGGVLVERLARTEGWRVVSVSRRPVEGGTVRGLAIDLRDDAACAQARPELAGVTHVFYAGYHGGVGTWATQTDANARLFRNALALALRNAPHLERVMLFEGTKYYGNHLGPFRTPAKESDPRHLPPNFYFDQEDLLRERRAGQPWTWTVLRPHSVCGTALGQPLNLVLVIALYATMLRELGLPLAFPGAPDAFRAVFQVTDADLLAKAALWAAEDPCCADQAFNITNGDFFRCENLWPAFAAHFGMHAGAVRPTRLVRAMADKETLWAGIVARHGLRRTRLADIAAWTFGDYVFGCAWDIMSDTTKCRRAGFLEFEDSEAMFLRHFDALADARVIPRRP